MFQKIVLPQDLEEWGPSGQSCVQVIKDYARPEESEIHLVTVIPDFGMPMVASFFPSDVISNAQHEVASRLEKFAGELFPDWAHIVTHVRIGKPSREIVALADEIEANLIIMPPHAGALGQEMIGSCTTRVVHNASCSVLVVRPN